MTAPAKRPTYAARWLAGAALALAAAGCAHAESEGPRPLYAPQARGRAALYLDSTPERPHRDIGLVQAVGEGNRSRSTDVLHSLRREGQRMGCDAISNVDVSHRASKAEAMGVCIQWSDDEPDARAKRAPAP